MEIGQRVKLFRKERKWTQEELAKASGLSKNSIYNYENGKRNMDTETLNRIADALGIAVLDLLMDLDKNDISKTVKIYDKQNELQNKINSEIKYKSYMVLKNVFQGYGYEVSPFDESEALNCKTDICIRKNDSIVAVINKSDLEKVAYSFYSSNLGLIKNVIDGYESLKDKMNSIL